MADSGLTAVVRRVADRPGGAEYELWWCRLPDRWASAGGRPLSAPDQGDEAVAYGLSGSIEDTEVPMTFTIVRSGPMLVAFCATDAADGAKAQVPEDVIGARLEKLGELER